jgi:hypothetical protein
VEAGNIISSGVTSGLIFPIGYPFGNAGLELQPGVFCALHGLDTAGALR